MRRDPIIKTCSLAGSSDLTVLAPIRKGLVPALDSVTYKTRAQRVLRTLHAGRSTAHEFELFRIMSDAVERVGRIHSVRIAVIEPDDKVLLAVTFDGPWEAYIRVIWQKVARLLDLVFCNTEDYVYGWESSFEVWGAWLKSRQVETSFLYALPALSAHDARYLRMQERYVRQSGDLAGNDLAITQMSIPSAELVADIAYKIGVDATDMGVGEKLETDDATRPAVRQGLRGLLGLYRLADLFPPGTHDGEVLYRAAHELLPEFERLAVGTGQAGVARARDRFDEAIDWFLPVTPSADPPSRLPAEPPAKSAKHDPRDIQAGIMAAYPADAVHGCIWLLRFESGAALATWIGALNVTRAADQDATLPPVLCNVAFTVDGLRAAGLGDDEIAAWPEEFVQGMGRRAGVLGDMYVNHPRRWRLPGRNWHLGVNAPDLTQDDPAARVELDTVHAVVTLRLAASSAMPTNDARALLFAEMQRLAQVGGVTPLSIQWTQRLRAAGVADAVDHFHFGDGQSQPVFAAASAGQTYKNHVHLGEALVGYANASDLAPEAPDPMRLNGSFLVVRKLRQDVDALETAVATARPAVARADVLSKMMGRFPIGHAQQNEPRAARAPGAGLNDFDYKDDIHGSNCPFHAHIRRANPRVELPFAQEKDKLEPFGARPPRLIRRGMSYGPQRARDANGAPTGGPDPQTERGLVFMAYNASIGEQFEVVQRWLAGGNASGSYSGQSDPFLGVGEAGRERYFRFEDGGKVVRMHLDGGKRTDEEPQPIVRLEWGLYLFAPSLSALELLRQRAAAGPLPLPQRCPWRPDAGEREILRLRQLKADAGDDAALLGWKAALEDPQASANFDSASIWAAIRTFHGGVLDTPYGVLVADRTLCHGVLLDPQRKLTATGYLPRMQGAFGPIYLGLDAGPQYQSESAACNGAIGRLSPDDAFDTTRRATQQALGTLVKQAHDHARDDVETRWSLGLDVRELIDPAIADLCEGWFGISTTGGHFRRGGYRWDATTGAPYYPGHFMVPSRFIFQPHPGELVEQVAAAHGAALHQAMTAYLAAFPNLTAPVAFAVLKSPPGNADPDFAARTLVGAIMGFVPTVDGALRRVLNEWLRIGTLWSLRAAHAGDPALDLATARARYGQALLAGLQLRPPAELIWRTANAQHTIGSGPHQVHVAPGRVVVIAAVSAGHQTLESVPPDPDVSFVFGGDRSVTPHPTHACPAQPVALATLLGFFAGLAETVHPLRPGPGPLTLVVGGTVAPAPPPPPAPAAGSRVLAASAPKLTQKGWTMEPRFSLASRSATLTAAPAAAPPLVLALGDSWLSTNLGGGRSSLVDALFGRYECIVDAVAPGQRLETMAGRRHLEDAMRSLSAHPGVKAILLGGGGNDVTNLVFPQRSNLYRMLLQKPAVGAPELDAATVLAFIDQDLGAHFDTIFKRLSSAGLPILVHAYDHPIPDGRGPLQPDPAAWLKPVFDARDVQDANPAATLARRAKVMAMLIDRLNAAVVTAARPYPGLVIPLDLTGTLAAQSGPHTDYWHDELHPSIKGFDLLANKVAAALVALGIP